MTTITKEVFTEFVITNGVDEEGTEVVFELPCGCMVAKEEAGNDLILCDAHDDECLDNEGKTFEELVADVFTVEATVAVEEEVAEAVVEVAVETTSDDIEYDPLPEAFNDDADEFTLDELVEEEPIAEEKEEETMTITMKNTVKQMKEYASAHNINIKGLKVKADIFARITNAPVEVEETVVELTLDELVADDEPMVDDLRIEDMVIEDNGEEVAVEPIEETVVEETPADAVALAQELLDLINKGTNFSTLMSKVKENATAIVNGGVVKSEPKKTEQPKQSTKKPVETKKPESKKQGASEASAITKFSTAHIIKETATSVTFEGDGEEYIFLKNEAGKTLIRKIGSNTNQYMSAKYLQHLVYDINTKASRSLFRKIKSVGLSDATQNNNTSSTKADGAASEASAKEKNNTAKNNSAEVISMLGTEIPKAWFTQYVQNEAMTKKHGNKKMLAVTIVAEYKARKA